MTTTSSELSENVSYMKLLHELKAAFPTLPDEVVSQCINQHGIDKTVCSGALRQMESDHVSMTANHSYAPARAIMSSANSADQIRRQRRMSWQGKVPHSSSSRSSFQSSNNMNEQEPRFRSSRNRPTSLLPIGITYMPMTKKSRQSCDSVPKVVLTPESPHSKMSRTLYDPNGNNSDSGLNICGTASTLTATCIDIDMQSLSSSSSLSSSDSSSDSLSSSRSSAEAVEAVCNIATATLSRGNLRLYDQDGQPVATTAFTSLSMSSQTTTSSTATLPQTTPTTHLIMSSRTPPSRHQKTNPYRRIFEQRQAFYERFSNQSVSSDLTSLKSGWQRSTRKQDVFTVNANIEPFGPFVIEHDVRAEGPGKLVRNEYGSNPMVCLNPSDEGHQKELRYATSHSEDGIESHLEVSLGKDGSVIKTRHQRLYGNQNSEENSVLRLQYGEGGKVLQIQQTQSMLVPRRQHLVPPPAAGGPPNQMPNHHYHRPNSAYCTQQGPSSVQAYIVPKYNSMPNLDGRRRITAQQELGFKSYPADEEKRLAYTRALISHQMDQRMKLDRRLQGSKVELQSISRNIQNLQYLLNARTKFIQTGVVDVEVTDELETDVSRLQHHCDDMVGQVTQLTQGIVPLGETSIDFYESLPAVLNQLDKKGEHHEQNNLADEEQTCSSMPPAICSAAATTALSTSLSASNMLNNSSGPRSTVLNFQNNSNLQWACTKCTFLNHPALKVCEECDMPRFGENNTGTAIATNNSGIAVETAENQENCICHGVASKTTNQ